MVNADLKKRILKIAHRNKLSHLGSYFSSVDIIDEIYSKMNGDDIFILSSGHAALAMYACIEKYHGIDAEYLFKKHGGHPHWDEKDKLYCSTGSLGLGMTIALGRAVANPNRMVYVLISDGECAEGSIWEALKTIEEQNIKNIEIHVNVNGFAAYMEVNTKYLVDRLLVFKPDIKIHYTTVEQFSFLKGMNAHYHVMSGRNLQEALHLLTPDDIIAGRNLSGEIDLMTILNETDFNYLEIGCYDGCNLRSLATQFSDRKIYGIDPFIDDGNLGGTGRGNELHEQRENTYLNIKGLQNVSLFECTSREFNETNPNYEEMNISCVFVDGSHHYEDIVHDVAIAINCIKNNKSQKGTVVFHDVNIHDVQRGMEYFEECCSDNGIKTIKDLDQNKAVYKLKYTG